VPKWCPKRLSPAALRIYGFKDENAHYMYFVFGGIHAHRYAVRCTGTTYQNANSILKDGIPEGLCLADGEVLELDDGIRPVYLCMKNGKLEVTDFDKERIYKDECSLQ